MEMPHRISFILTLLVGVAQFASAQTPQPIPATTDAQLKSAKDVHVVLEMRWLTLGDNYLELVESDRGLGELREMGTHTIRDQQQTERLIRASGDKRGNVGSWPAVVLQDGEKRELSLVGRRAIQGNKAIQVEKSLDVWKEASRDELQGNEAIQATVSKDRKTIHVAFTWAKQKDGKERFPVTTAAVPMGSHLMVHTHDVLSSGDKWRERQPVFLLISPRLAVQREKENQPVAKQTATGFLRGS